MNDPKNINKCQQLKFINILERGKVKFLKMVKFVRPVKNIGQRVSISVTHNVKVS